MKNEIEITKKRDNDIKEMIQELENSASNNSFVKLVMSKYRGEEKGLKNIYVKPIMIKENLHFSFTYRYKTNDIIKNYSLEETISLINEIIGTEFLSVILSTTINDIYLDFTKKGKSRLLLKKKENKDFISNNLLSHNREKERFIKAEKENLYLEKLGVLTKEGFIINSMRDKFKQINKFVEIMEGLILPFINNSEEKKQKLNFYDMGCGKGYLTFSLYDYLVNKLDLNVSATGIEAREEIVNKCNKISSDIRYDSLKFVKGYINDYKIISNETSHDDEDIKVLIALHACNTATDDAIFKGISSDMDIIVCSPCCHKELRPQLKPNSDFDEIISSYGILKERQAEIVTDGLRALLMEYSGYKTKVFEFISTEHTGKNLMITGVKRKIRDEAFEVKRKKELLEKIKNIKEQFGITNIELEGLINKNKNKKNLRNFTYYEGKRK